MSQSIVPYFFASRTVAGLNEKRKFGSLFRLERLDAVVLMLYAAVLSWNAFRHLPWIDEAQAWLIARDVPVRDMLLRRLHYEGAPPLWHLLLKAAIRLHLPYGRLNWMAGALGFAGVFVLVRFSPFPRIFRWLLPFTFYLVYQYAVVARPYALLPLLLFALAGVYSLPRPQPVLFALVGGLLANINAHAAVLSCVFAAVYVYDRYWQGRISSLLQRRVLAATGLFAAFCLLSVVTAYPAPDAMVVPGSTGKIGKGNTIMRRLLPPEQMPAFAPPLDLPLNTVAEMRLTDPHLSNVTQTASASAEQPLTMRKKIRLRLRDVCVLSADVATFPLAESNTLGVLFLILFAFWLASRGHLRLLLPWLIAVPFAAFVWIYDHHTGIFAVALLAAAWISLKRPTEAPITNRMPASRGIAYGLSAVTLLVVVLQIGWTVNQVRREWCKPYDAGKQTEAFLARHYSGKRIAGFGFQSVSLQPYAARNIFFNQDHTYWLWSTANPIDRRRTEALIQHPDVVVVADLIQEQDSLYNQWTPRAPAGYHPYAEMIFFWQEHGYHETQRFCGYRSMRAGMDNVLCEVIFERNQRAL